MITLAFPCLLIAASAGASMVYAFDGNGWKSLYWLAAAVLNVCVTFGK